MNNKKYYSLNKSIFITLLYLPIILLLSSIAHADQTIGNGSSWQINSGSTEDLNCQNFTISSGGTLNIADNGTLQEVTTLTTEGTLDGSAVSGSILKLSSWINNGTVTSIPKTIQFDTLCGAITVAGTSDTDGDGISDDLEGGTDINSDTVPDLDVDNDGIYNFLDLDSDGDGVTDAIEGVADIDNNNIPNYLDSNDQASIFADFRINEVDANTEGVDVAEFIELYDGGTGNTALDGLVLVLYNGSTDQSYKAYDLDGQTSNASGYFVLCGDATKVPNCDMDVSPNTNLIQNGADAIALFAASAIDFPVGAAVTTTSLIDALVYGTGDDANLLTLLNPAQPQISENDLDSMQRCPNGAGDARDTDGFKINLPTPGLTNDCSTVTACGNSNVETGEFCDDGNTDTSDGCSATCTIEAGYQCAVDANTDDVCDTGGNGSVISNNASLAITSAAIISIEENNKTIITITATTENNIAKTFTITGGADQIVATIDENSGELSFTETVNFENPLDVDGNNTYEIEVTVTDANSSTAIQLLQVTVTNINDAPTAAGETLETNEDVAVSDSVSADVNDEDGDTLSFSLASDVMHGTLNFDAVTGGYSYMPSPQFNGMDSFVYRVTDTSGASATAEVKITVLPVEDKPMVFLNTNYGISSKLDWNTQNWTNGQGSNFIIDGVSVDINLGGTTPYVDVSDNANITGGLGVTEQSLSWTVDPNTRDEVGKMVITFDRPVSNVAFSLLDIDSGNLAQSSQMEQMTVDGLFVGEPATSTLTPVDAAAVSVTDNQLVAAAESPVAKDTNNGNVDVQFTGLVDTIVITYGSQAGANVNPAWLDFAISDISFQKAQMDNTVLFIEDEPAVLITDPSAAVYDMLEDDIVSLMIDFTTLADGADEIISVLGESFVLDADKQVTVTNAAGVELMITYIAETTMFTVTAPDGSSPVVDEALSELILSMTYQNLDHTPTLRPANDDRLLSFKSIDASGLESEVAVTRIIVEAVNNAPIIVSDLGGDTAALSVEENQSTVTTVAATDYEADTLTYTLSGGADEALFEVEAVSGVLSFAIAPDFEALGSAASSNDYIVEVTVTDNGEDTPSDTQLLTITVTDSNDAPVIESSDTVSMPENTTAVITIVATDQDANDTHTYELTGGADADLFAFNPADNTVVFKTPVDFEALTDADKNNVYEFELTVTDANGLTNMQLHKVTVTDVNDAPIMTSATAISMAENAMPVVTVTSTDQDANDTPTYTLSSGADKDVFTIDSATGALTFTAAPDFENAADTDKDNVYVVEVTVTDTAGAKDVETHTITVTDTQDAPVMTSSDTVDIAENEVTVITVTATDQDIPEDTLSFSLSGGADKDLFEVNPTSGVLVFKEAPSFEDAKDVGADNTYEVEVSVDDGQGNIVPQLISITVINVNDVPVFSVTELDAMADENQTAVATLIATDEDNDALSYTIIAGIDQGFFSLSSSGVLSFNIAPDFEVPSDSDANNVYDLEINVVDSNGGEATQLVHVTVKDVGIRFSMKAFLQGAFNGTDMSDDLRELGLIPEQEPYTELGHTVAPWSQTLNTDLLTTEGDDALVDWMLLEVRSSADDKNILLAQAVLIQRDGDIVSSSSATNVFSYDGLPAGDYYLSLRHRNHLGVMTEIVTLGSALHMADFTDIDTVTSGNDIARFISGDIALLWAGDANHDGGLISQGAKNDLNILLGNILGHPANKEVNTNYSLSGYLSSDINMDGRTVFAGVGNDVNIVMGNVLLHNDNDSFSANFIAQEQLPVDVEGVANVNPMGVQIITGWTTNSDNPDSSGEPDSGDSSTGDNTDDSTTGDSSGSSSGSGSSGSGDSGSGDSGSSNEPPVEPTDTTAPKTDATVNNLQTDNTSPAISGSLPTGDTDAETNLYTVSVEINSQSYPASNNGDRTWGLAAGKITSLDEGFYDVIITVTDAADNSSSTTLVNKIEINNTGFLIDSALEGIRYISGRFDGYTDSSGLFKYDSEAGVTFFIGNEDTGIKLGNAAARQDPHNNKRKIINLFDLAGTEDENDPRVLNMAKFLQSFDVDKDASNGITIDNRTREAIMLLGLRDKIDFNLDVEIFAQSNDLYGLFNDLADHFGEHRGLIDTEDAKAHILAVRDNTLPTASYDSEKVRGDVEKVKILTGVFKSVTGIVESLEYRSGNQYGRTNAAGEFQYEEGKTVKFHIYQLELGITEGKAIITPADLIAATSFDHPKPRNIVRLLAYFDAIKGDEKITIDKAVREALEKYRSQIDLNLSDGKPNAELGIPKGENEFTAQFGDFEIGQEILNEIKTLRTGG